MAARAAQDNLAVGADDALPVEVCLMRKVQVGTLLELGFPVQANAFGLLLTRGMGD